MDDRVPIMPLNKLIAADVGRALTRPEIVGRVERSAAAARLEATPLDQVVLDDWRRISQMKDTPTVDIAGLSTASDTIQLVVTQSGHRAAGAVG